MSGRWWLRIRAALTEPRALFGSWKLSVVLMIAACVFHVLLLVYSWTVPSHVVASIAGLAVFRLCWLLLLANTVVCIWNRFRGLRWSSILFHGSFVIVLLGVLASAASRQESKLRVAAGESFSGAAEQFLARGGGAMPEPFTVVSVTPEFWRDQLLFTKLEAVLDFEGEMHTTRINRPLWIEPFSFLRLSGFGLAPRYEIVDSQGRVVETAFAKLNVFPPGQRDFLMPERYPYRVYLEIYPDAEVTAEGVVNRTNALVAPVLVANVYRGHLAVASAPLRAGESLELEGVSIRFPEIGMWGELTYVRDAGVPVIFLGCLVGLLGLVMRLWSRR